MSCVCTASVRDVALVTTHVQNPSSQTAKAAAAAFNQLLAVVQLQEAAPSHLTSGPSLLEDVACRLLALGAAPTCFLLIASSRTRTMTDSHFQRWFGGKCALKLQLMESSCS